MSGKTKKPKNILVNPAEYASHLEGLEEHDSLQIQNLEEHLAHRLRLGGAITYIDEDGNHVIEDQDGIRPFTDGSTFPQAPDNVELEIRELAFRNGIHADMTELDQWCEAVSANAGDEIQSDEVERLIIGLRRIGNLPGIELTKLHARYMEEIMNR